MYPLTTVLGPTDLRDYVTPPDVLDPNRRLGAPEGQRLRDQLWPVVAAQGLRRAGLGQQLRQERHHPGARERSPDLHRQRFAIALVERVEHAEAPAVVERIVHEVERPGPIAVTARRVLTSDTNQRVF
jgi:hypothetical protein